jgi:hypothetical protein
MSAVSFASILLAGVASILVEQVWYSPRVFGATWLRLTNVSPEQVEQGKKRTWSSASIGLLASMLIALVMTYIGIALQIGSLGEAAGLGALCWVGFCAPTLLNQVLWDQKPLLLFLINSLYWLLSFIVMALILFYTAALQ